MLKKFLSVTAISVLAIGLSACSSDVADSPEEPLVTASPSVSVSDGETVGISAPTEEPSAEPTESLESNAESVDEVSDWLMTFVKATMETEPIDYMAYAEDMKVAINGKEIKSGDRPLAEDLTNSLTPEEIAAFSEVTAKYTPLGEYFDFSNSTVEEKILTETVTFGFLMTSSLSANDSENTAITIYNTNIEASEEKAVVPHGTITTSPAGIFGEMTLHLVKVDGQWKIDARTWVDSVLDREMPAIGEEEYEITIIDEEVDTELDS